LRRRLSLPQGPEHGTHHAEQREVPTAAVDGALAVVRRLEHDRRAAVSEGLHCRLLAEACTDDVTVLRRGRRADQHVVAVEDPAAAHAVALHLQKKRIVARQEAAIHGDVAAAVLGEQRRFTGMDAAVVRDRLRALGRGVAEQADTARPRVIAFDVAFALQRVQQVGHRLRRLDLKLARNLADARLVRVVREEVYQIVIDALLELREWLRHPRSSPCSGPTLSRRALMYLRVALAVNARLTRIGSRMQRT